MRALICLALPVCLAACGSGDTAAEATPVSESESQAVADAQEMIDDHQDRLTTPEQSPQSTSDPQEAASAEGQTP